MDNINQPNQNNEMQEINLIDLVVVLWRRRKVIVVTTILGIALATYKIATHTQILNVSAIFFVGEAAVITEEVSFTEALAGKKEGVIATQLLMKQDQSQTLLSSIYLPQAISKQLVDTEAEYLKFESNISIEGGNEDLAVTSSVSPNIIKISATTTDEFVSVYKKIIDEALVELVQNHNEIYDRHQLLTEQQIASKNLELQLQSDPRAIASGKQPLISRQLTNQINRSEHKDADLNKKIDMRLQLAILNAENAIKAFGYNRPTRTAEREIARAETNNLRKNNGATRSIANTIADIEQAHISLARLDDLVKHNSDIRLKLMSQLSGAETDRSNLRSRLSAKNNTSTLITEAINVIDSRVARYETKISEVDQQLHVDLPSNRLLIKMDIELLNRKLANQEEDLALQIQEQNFEMSVLLEDFDITKQIQATNLLDLENTLDAVKHDERVSKLNRVYTQGKLDNEKDEIETAFLGHDASFEARTLRLNSDIEALEVVLKQSVPSKILASATARPERSRSPILVGIVIVMFFGAIGLFFAFFLELLDKAQSRIEEHLTQINNQPRR